MTATLLDMQGQKSLCRMEVGFEFSLEHLNEKFFSEFCEYYGHWLHVKPYPVCFSYFMYNVCFIWLLSSQKFVCPDFS